MGHSVQVDALRETLQYLVSSDIPGEHKRVLIGAVTDSLRQQEKEDRRIETTQHDVADWQPDEIKALQDFLQGKVAHGWQHADELLMRVSRQLHRGIEDVRRKATELGFASAIDYRVARQQTLSESS
jgi:hypothetical protein